MRFRQFIVVLSDIVSELAPIFGMDYDLIKGVYQFHILEV